MSRTLDAALEAAYGFYEANNLVAAESACSEVLRKAPRNAAALHLLATISLRTGDAKRATELFARIAKLAPADDRVLEHLAIAQLAQQAYAEAERTLQRALRLARTSRASLHLHHARALHGLARAEEAEASLREALRIEPNNVHALMNLGNALVARGRTQEARECYIAASGLSPDDPEPAFNLALLQEREGDYAKAEAAYARLLERFPEYHDASINRGVALERLDRAKEAIECYRGVLKAQPRSVRALANLAKVLRSEGRFTEARTACLEALELQPNFVDAVVNHAAILADEGDAAAALREYQRALEIEPQSPDVRLACAVLELACGDLRAGWKSYAARPSRRIAEASGLKFADRLPEVLRGTHVLLLGEQGLGDELFFLRYAQALTARGALVHVQSDARLVNMLRRTGTFESVVDPGSAMPAASHTVLVGDLPHVLNDLVFPKAIALTPLQEELTRVERYLSGLGPEPYLGLTWRAGTPPTQQIGRVDRALYKEAPLASLAEALQRVPGTILGLQRGAREGELEFLSAQLGRAVHDCSSMHEDLEQMLALLDRLDEYIGVSNTNMHLRAGLGRAARVLVPHPPEWRWMWSGARSPWFPQNWIYRETPQNGWRQAVMALKADLSRCLRRE